MVQDCITRGKQVQIVKIYIRQKSSGEICCTNHISPPKACFIYMTDRGTSQSGCFTSGSYVSTLSTREGPIGLIS